MTQEAPVPLHRLSPDDSFHQGEGTRVTIRRGPGIWGTCLNIQMRRERGVHRDLSSHFGDSEQPSELIKLPSGGWMSACVQGQPQGLIKQSGVAHLLFLQSLGPLTC